MAKQSVQARNRKREFMVERFASRRSELKKEGNYEALDRLPRNASPVRVRNRCKVTGRARGYMRRFGLSRLVFRKWALEGKLPGVQKTSW